MEWFKKSSTGLRFDLNPSPSAKCRVFLYLTIWLSLSLMLMLVNSFSTFIDQHWLLILPVFWAFALCFCYFYFQPQSDILSCSVGGEVLLSDGSSWQLSADSYINFFGCLLQLKRLESTQTIKRFVYRDSVKQVAYCRLCRTITRVRQM